MAVRDTVPFGIYKYSYSSGPKPHFALPKTLKLAPGWEESGTSQNMTGSQPESLPGQDTVAWGVQSSSEQFIACVTQKPNSSVDVYSEFI